MSDRIFIGQPPQAAVEWFRRKACTHEYTVFAMNDGTVYGVNIEGTAERETVY